MKPVLERRVVVAPVEKLPPSDDKVVRGSSIIQAIVQYTDVVGKDQPSCSSMSKVSLEGKHRICRIRNVSELSGLIKPICAGPIVNARELAAAIGRQRCTP